MSNLSQSNSSLSTFVGKQILENPSVTPYDQKVSRETPACFVFLVDQSGSMGDAWGVDSSKTKADLVALYLNDNLNNLINISQKTEPDPRHYFDIAVIGYGKNSTHAEIIWEAPLDNEIFVSPAQLRNNPTGIAGEIEREVNVFGSMKKVITPISFWFRPVAKSLTPMGNALDKCSEILETWIAKHPNSLPPIVINITDGEQTDCTNEELLKKAKRLKNLSTMYGNTLFINVHISSDSEDKVIFPQSKSELPQNPQSHLLYEMSSVMPRLFAKRIAAEIHQQDLRENTSYVGMSFQASVQDLVKSLNIGTLTYTP